MGIKKEQSSQEREAPDCSERNDMSAPSRVCILPLLCTVLLLLSSTP